MSRLVLSVAVPFAFAFALRLAAPALAGDAPATPRPDADAPPPLGQRDAAFLAEAAWFNDPEIHVAILAQDWAENPAVTAYARLANSDHNDLANDLTEMAGRFRVNLPDPCDQGGDRTLNRLRAEYGAAFDRDYLEAEVEEHRAAIALFEREAASAGGGEVAAFAARTLPVLRQHLALAGLIAGALAPSQAAR